MGCEGGVRQECKINELPQQQQRDSQKRGKIDAFQTRDLAYKYCFFFPSGVVVGVSVFAS